MNPPRAAIGAGVLQWDVSVSANDRPDLEAIAAQHVGPVVTWLEYGRPQIAEFNTRLGGTLLAAINLRRERVKSNLEFLSTSKIPVRRRGDAPQTYSAPVVRRPSTATRTTPRGLPQRTPEPVLDEPAFEHALGVIRSFGRTLERTPATYASLDEEARRDLFLAALNTHFEGQATGETFNASSKTDILIRVEDKNVFVGECKRWAGSKGFAAAMDQLMSYATWRDTKLSQIIFVGVRDIGPVIEKVRQALADHERFKAWTPSPDTELRCRVTWPADERGSGDLAVLFFHLPDPT